MRQLFNEGWEFLKATPGSAYPQTRGQKRQPLCLPHDWAITDTEAFYRDADGWYFHVLNTDALPAEYTRVLLYFDGVYMDTRVYLNGQPVAEHHYGYTAFSVDLSGMLRPGDNEVAVQVRYRCPNSRWYSGAGIFRDVWLYTFQAAYMIPDGWAVQTQRVEEDTWRLRIAAETHEAAGLSARASLYDDGRLLWTADAVADETGFRLETALENIQAWSVDAPRLYKLELVLLDQRETLRIGFRETVFTPDQGFFLNGAHVKLHGVCLHHDLGALGAAFHPDAARRQLMLMRDMGANAVRTSHNPPARAFLDLCDEMGMLVVDEAYDMWELPKTEFDNARFFPDTWRDDVAAWVRRDRCHPSVIMWSIGNEIQDVFLGEKGYQWTLRLAEAARAHDVFGHARVTFGSNYMPWEGAQRCAEAIGLPGYNYGEMLYEQHHQAHPDWVIYGSETSSMVQSRGVYHFPMTEDILAEEDLQCSALLNSKTSWGTQSLQRMLTEDRRQAFSLGQFIWSGIDYIGEPTPYHTKNSYFGQADTACFPKDNYFFYQSMWSDVPMVHIGVSWKWNIGQLIDVPVMTNCASAELFLNGRSLGKKAVNRDDEAACLPVWHVPYEDGVLEARGYDAGGQELARDDKRSYGDPVALTIRKEDGDTAGSLAFLTIQTLDADGHPVEDANTLVHVTVCGSGVLMGLDNGDSTDDTSYQTDSKRLFSGKLLAIIGIASVGEVRVTVSSPGLRPAEIVWQAREVSEARPLPTVAARLSEVDPSKVTPWVRRINITAPAQCALSPERDVIDFLVRREPANARDPVTVRVTTAQGVDFPGAKAEWLDEQTVRVRAWADGVFYLRAVARHPGAKANSAISVYPVRADGFGAVTLDPYSLIAGSLADHRAGEISPGNEQGIAFAREGFSGIGFSRVDFGPVGSDRLELPIFALEGNPHDIILWDGWPEEGGRRLMTCRYQMPSIWNTYQSGFYTLPEPLTGLHDLFFSAVEKVHMKGFRFERQSRAERVNRGADADEIYGDRFTRSGEDILDIGNNVILAYDHMVFWNGAPCLLRLTGRTKHDETPIVLLIRSEAGEEIRETLTFRRSDEMEEQTFSVTPLPGPCRVEFVFLPGCHFDFRSFKFEVKHEL